jgi:hypothetical protein
MDTALLADWGSPSWLLVADANTPPLAFDSLSNIDDKSIFVAAGATLTLPRVTRYSRGPEPTNVPNSNFSGWSRYLRAETGGVLSLPNLAEVTGVARNPDLYTALQAARGGQLLLPVLRTVTTSSSPAAQTRGATTATATSSAGRWATRTK